MDAGARRDPRSVAGAGLVLAAAGLFAVNGSVSKTVMATGLDPLHLVQIRCLGAGALFALVAAARRPRSLAIGGPELARVLLYGVVGVAMVQWTYFAAISRMPVSIALLIEFTAPLLVALWLRVVRCEPVRGRIWAALALVLAGLALVARVWAGLTLSAAGVGFAALAALALAVYYLAGERRLADRDPLSLAAWSFTAAGLFWGVLLPVWQYPLGRLGRRVPLGGGALLSPHLVPAWALVAWVVLLGTAAPFGLALAGLARVGATRSGLIGTTEPALAGIVAWAVLGETLSPVQVVGALVVLAGIVLAETSRPVVEDSIETPVETLIETPVETLIETPAETLVEAPIEMPAGGSSPD